MIQLSRMKTTGGNIAVFQYRPPLNFYSKSMGRIINDLKAVLFCNLINGLHIAWIAEDMGCKDGRSIFSDGCFYFGRINVKRLPVNVYKHRPTTFPHNAAGGGYKRKRCGDNFSLEIQSFDGHLQSHSAIGDKQEML